MIFYTTTLSSLCMCIAGSGSSSFLVMSESVTTIYLLPINVTSQGGNTTVEEGSSLNLTCNGEHFTYRQWTRVVDEDSPSSVVSTTSDGRIEVTSDFQLLFQGILLSDEAQYRCTLGNNLGIVRVIVNVKVVGKSLSVILPMLRSKVIHVSYTVDDLVCSVVQSVVLQAIAVMIQ